MGRQLGERRARKRRGRKTAGAIALCALGLVLNGAVWAGAAQAPPTTVSIKTISTPADRCELATVVLERVGDTTQPLTVRYTINQGESAEADAQREAGDETALPRVLRQGTATFQANSSLVSVDERPVLENNPRFPEFTIWLLDGDSYDVVAPDHSRAIPVSCSAPTPPPPGAMADTGAFEALLTIIGAVLLAAGTAFTSASRRLGRSPHPNPRRIPHRSV